MESQIEKEVCLCGLHSHIKSSDVVLHFHPRILKIVATGAQQRQILSAAP